MSREIEIKSRIKSPVFWIGLVAAVYEAVVSSLSASGVYMPPVVGAIGVALATVLIYCNGNNPSLNVY